MKNFSVCCSFVKPPLVTTAIVALLVVNLYSQKSAESQVDFNRDVRSILADRCFSCHGPDENKRKAGLRLDDGIGAFRRLPSGYTAILPGNADQSELILRITEEFPEDRMPPLKSGKTLTEEEIRTLVKWIDAGANWQKHWSFVPPVRRQPPEVVQREWPQNTIDRFILARLEREGM